MHRRLWLPLVALTLLIVLAAGLSQVSFVGTRYELPSEAPTPSGLPHQPEAPPSPPVSLPWWTDLILIAAGTLLLASIVFLIFNPKDLKEVIQRASALSLWVIAIYIIIRRLREMNVVPGTTELPGEGLSTPNDLAQPLPSYEQFQPPLWITFFIILTLLGLVGLSAYLIWRIWKRTSREGRSLLADELALVSRRTVEELRAGAALGETILHCYHEMCRLLSERTSIALGRAMTVREFERELASIGIQEAHIERLSRLFEWARYSDRRPTPAQEQEAIIALEAIASRYGQRAQAHTL